jgi:hypothetical protein
MSATTTATTTAKATTKATTKAATTKATATTTAATMAKQSKKDIVASLDAAFTDSQPNGKRKKKKKKKLSGDARRRAKKRKLQDAGEQPTASSTTTTTTTAPATTTTSATAATTTTPTPKKKKNRKNTKCKCSRCGRTLQKKNLNKHLTEGGPNRTGCDGTRPTFNPNHVPMHIREQEKEANTQTDASLMDMFAAYCQQHQLAGSDDDFTTWSETVLENAEATMKSVHQQEQKPKEKPKQKPKPKPKPKPKVHKKSQEHHRPPTDNNKPLPAVYSGKTLQPRRTSTGVKKTFVDSEEDEDED